MALGQSEGQAHSRFGARVKPQARRGGLGYLRAEISSEARRLLDFAGGEGLEGRAEALENAEMLGLFQKLAHGE